MFVKARKVVLSLMAFATTVVIFLFATGTCHIEFHFKEKPVISSINKAATMEILSNTVTVPETRMGKSDAYKKAM